ncbi:MAG: 5-(carboxyamino)imidazole ribonucleotide mutase [Candidatus Thermoplasmatota archaeon]|jgi:5-(carboxyamino)imidazole ribonucleotide mutase|nr:5-(carboxyamino)imidazole ribonucleotide mutase [Candidatus Thermoplasmatota archaeon]MCL5441320.1 5-(carboxyamino)imidazole ribonucleotide mutase [Candidatus Thermoplasmatota archaeon]
MKKVAVIMGSKNDYDYMKDAVTTLNEFGVETEVRIVSAHRTPRFMLEFSSEASGRGVEVIIAGAGGAAHLPGMTASVTHLPVIGVPIPTKNLNGLDSLLSIVQMPSGIPVATVAIGNSRNAALLALRILSIKYPEIKKMVQEYMESEEKRVLGESV